MNSTGFTTINNKSLTKMKWKSDFDKSVVLDNFTDRNWNKTQGDEDWNVYWATVWTVRNIFNPKTGYRLNENQIINHFPNHYELTRKDLMVKNIKRYRKELEKDNHPLSVKDELGNYQYLDFVPQTFILPGEYSLFVEEFHRNPNPTWIVKPAGSSQGKGIFLLSKPNQLKKISNGTFRSQNISLRESYVISKYIDNPLLIGGKKFDLRLYVLVTNYKPLKIWMYSKGFARFCNETYTTDVAEMDNMFVHLTNVAIQKYSDKYSEKHGGKWGLQSLKFYIESVFGKDTMMKCFEGINTIIIQSIKSVQSVIMNDKHCFEMYGYDILLDSNCKPWLIEINASPSLTTTNEADKILKKKLIDDVFKIVIPSQSEPGEKLNEDNNFYVLHDEGIEATAKRINKKQNSSTKIWK